MGISSSKSSDREDNNSERRIIGNAVSIGINTNPIEPLACSDIEPIQQGYDNKRRMRYVHDSDSENSSEDESEDESEGEPKNKYFRADSSSRSFENEDDNDFHDIHEYTNPLLSNINIKTIKDYFNKEICSKCGTHIPEEDLTAKFGISSISLVGIFPILYTVVESERGRTDLKMQEIINKQFSSTINHIFSSKPAFINYMFKTFLHKTSREEMSKTYDNIDVPEEALIRFGNHIEQNYKSEGKEDISATEWLVNRLGLQYGYGQFGTIFLHSFNLLLKIFFHYVKQAMQAMHTMENAPEKKASKTEIYTSSVDLLLEVIFNCIYQTTRDISKDKLPAMAIYVYSTMNILNILDNIIVQYVDLTENIKLYIFISKADRLLGDLYKRIQTLRKNYYIIYKKLSRRFMLAILDSSG